MSNESEPMNRQTIIDRLSHPRRPVFWIGNAPWFFHSSNGIDMKHQRKAKAKSVRAKKKYSSRRAELSTQQKLARTALALVDSEERLRAILDTAVEGIITIDHRGIIESVNPAAAKIFGYQPAEIIGQNVNILMPSPYHEQHDEYLANYHRTGKARIIGIGREVSGRRKDGTVFPLDLSISEVKLADRQLFAG